MLHVLQARSKSICPSASHVLQVDTVPDVEYLYCGLDPLSSSDFSTTARRQPRFHCVRHGGCFVLVDVQATEPGQQNEREGVRQCGFIICLFAVPAKTLSAHETLNKLSPAITSTTQANAATPLMSRRHIARIETPPATPSSILSPAVSSAIAPSLSEMSQSHLR